MVNPKQYLMLKAGVVVCGACLEVLVSADSEPLRGVQELVVTNEVESSAPLGHN